MPFDRGRNLGPARKRAGKGRSRGLPSRSDRNDGFPSPVNHCRPFPPFRKDHPRNEFAASAGVGPRAIRATAVGITHRIATPRAGTTLRRKLCRATMRCMANEDRRASQLLRGVLDLCLLAVMEEGPAYGYDMTKRLRARGLSIVGEGSIYPLLGRLESAGLVDTYRSASDGGPPRKYYSASRKGRRALADGVAEWRAARDSIDSILETVDVEVRT
jgi:PadR family transcriptional regulator PadR